MCSNKRRYNRVSHNIECLAILLGLYFKKRQFPHVILLEIVNSHPEANTDTGTEHIFSSYKTHYSISWGSLKHSYLIHAHTNYNQWHNLYFSLFLKKKNFFHFSWCGLQSTYDSSIPSHRLQLLLWNPQKFPSHLWYIPSSAGPGSAWWSLSSRTCLIIL